MNGESTNLSFEHRMTEVEDRSKSNTYRINEMERRQDALEKLTTTVEVLAVREKKVEADVDEIKTDVKTLTGKPAQRWEKIVETLITVLASALVGFFLARLGLK